MPASIVKQVKNTKIYSDGLIRLDKVRFSYPHIFVPQPVLDQNGNRVKKPDGSDKTSFSIQILIDKKENREMFLALKGVKDEMLKDNKLKDMAPERIFIKDGDKMRNQRTQEFLEETKGQWVVSCREERRPVVFGPDKSPWNKEDHADRVYGGCWGSVIIRPWFQDDKKWGKRINCGFSVVQFWKDGDPFGQGRMSEDTASEYLDEQDEDMGDTVSDEEVDDI